MNRKNTIVAGFLAASALFFGTAYAEGQHCDHHGGPGMKHGGMMEPGARADQRLTQFKSELKLTAQQEPLWQAFADKSKAAAEKAVQTMREHHKDDKPVTAPERMTRMQEMMKARLAAMESVNQSFNQLYAALTPEQKVAADKHLSHTGRHEHGAGPGKGRGPGKGAPAAAEPKKG